MTDEFMEVFAVDVDDLVPDESNPREPDDARMHLLMLSLQKMGFVMPIYADNSYMILSGHQRLTVAKRLGYKQVPVVFVDTKGKHMHGINLLFNRITNDFTAFDTGKKVKDKLSVQTLMSKAEEIPDFEINFQDDSAYDCIETNLEGLGTKQVDQYNKKSCTMADQFRRKGIRIPAVVTESGWVVNGIHRLFNAKEKGEDTWPVVTISDDLGELCLNFLNYLSMDYKVNEGFEALLRFSAYRRPQNNRGDLPKSYRFWANGEVTLPDKDSYSTAYWRKFRDMHGSCLDFGGGLCKVAPLLNSKGIECVDFEPYRINRESGVGKPDVEYSKKKAGEFLDAVASGVQFDSIFLASVLNSIPFYRDRMCVLAIVHALCNYGTIVYGTCRDISDFEYEYQGIRNANYFVFDSEPHVRLGDGLENPKIQKFHTEEEAAKMFKNFWSKYEFWKGGNVFYFRCSAPKRLNPKVLRQALEFEFDLPYADGSSMGLAKKAVQSFSKRLGIEI